MTDNLNALYGVEGVAPAAPANPLDLAAETQAERAKFETVSWGEAFSRSVGDEHALTNRWSEEAITAHAPDPNWDLPTTLIDDVESRGIPLEWLDEFADARSQGEYDALLDAFESRSDNDRMIAGMGGRGIAARLAASATDPVGFAVDAAASMAAGAGAANRVRKVARVVGAAGAVNAAVGASQSVMNPDYNVTSFMVDFAAGAGFGATFEGLGLAFSAAERARFTQSFQNLRDRVKSGTFGSDTLSAARTKGGSQAQGLDVAARDTIGGDARADLQARADDNADVDTTFAGAQNAMFGGTISSIGRTSADEQVRQLTRDLVPDPVQAVRRGADGAAQATTNEVAASDLATINRLTMWNQFRRVHEDVMRKVFSQEGAFGGMRRMFSQGARTEVNRKIGRILKGFKSGDADLNRAAGAARKMMDDAWSMMKRAGVKGMENAKAAADYFPRLPRRHLLDFLSSRMKSQTMVDKTIEELLHKGISQYRIANDLPLNEPLTRKVSQAYAKRLLTNAKAMPDAGGVSARDFDFVEDVLDDTNLSQSEKDEILSYFYDKDPVRGPDAKSSARLKQRLGMDETVSVKLDDGSDIHLADLFEDDVEHVLDRYAWESSGMSALAERGYSNWKDVDAIINDLHGQSRATDKEANALRVALKAIMGKPIENDPTGTLTRAIRSMNGVNFVLSMNQVFWSMLAENGAVMGMASMRSIVKQLPAFGQMLKQVKSGELGDDLARELASLAEPGTTMLRNTVSLRPDDYGMEGLNASPVARTLDRASAGAQRVTAVISALGPLTDFQQVLFSRSFAQRMFDFASGTQTLTDAMRERLMDYGLRKSDIEKLMEHMRAHAVHENGRLKSVALDKMDDELQRRVQVLMHRATRHVIQEQDIGATMPWMHGPIAKVFTQFRTFALVAAQRRTMHGLARHDMTAGLMFSFGMLWGGLGVLGRTYVNFPKDHPQRAKVSDPTQLAKSAFAATGESTILPMLVDTAMLTLGRGDPFFNNYNRSTGLGSDAVNGIPTVATINKIGKALGIPAAALRDDKDISESDVRAALGLIPFNNAVGIARFNRWMASQFPSDYEVQKQEQRRNR